MGVQLSAESEGGCRGLGPGEGSRGRPGAPRLAVLPRDGQLASVTGAKQEAVALSFPGVVLLVPQLHSVLTWLVLSQGPVSSGWGSCIMVIRAVVTQRASWACPWGSSKQ